MFWLEDLSTAWTMVMAHSIEPLFWKTYHLVSIHFRAILIELSLWLTPCFSNHFDAFHKIQICYIYLPNASVWWLEDLSTAWTVVVAHSIEPLFWQKTMCINSKHTYPDGFFCKKQFIHSIKRDTKQYRKQIITYF